MTDIVERLRAGNQVLLPILGEAADDIERLRDWNYQILQRADAAQTEVERLHEALETCRELRRGDAAMLQMHMARVKP